MGTRPHGDPGASSLEQMLRGSTTERVLKGAHCSVLIVK